jgi:hypothetical protein
VIGKVKRTQEETVVNAPDTGQVAFKGILAHFGVTHARQYSHAAFAEQVHIPCHDVVLPVWRACQQLGAAVIGIITHGTFGHVPGTAECVPAILHVRQEAGVVRKTVTGAAEI